jgi:hypothetical protein
MHFVWASNIRAEITKPKISLYIWQLAQQLDSNEEPIHTPQICGNHLSSVLRTLPVCPMYITQLIPAWTSTTQKKNHRFSTCIQQDSRVHSVISVFLGLFKQCLLVTWFMQRCAQLSSQHIYRPNWLALQKVLGILSFILKHSKMLDACFKQRTASVLDLPSGGGGQPCSSVPSEQSGCPSQRFDPRIHRIMSQMNSPSPHSVNVHTITVLLVLRQG